MPIYICLDVTLTEDEQDTWWLKDHLPKGVKVFFFMNVDLGEWSTIYGMLEELEMIKSYALLVFDEAASRGVDMACAVAGFLYNLVRHETANGYEQAIGRAARSANIKSEGENLLLKSENSFHRN